MRWSALARVPARREPSEARACLPRQDARGCCSLRRHLSMTTRSYAGPSERETGRTGDPSVAPEDGLARVASDARAQEDPADDDGRDGCRDGCGDRRRGTWNAREPRAHANRAPEIADLPAVRLRLAPEIAVGVHRNRMSDGAEHRQVRDRVGVRVGPGEVDALGLFRLADRLGLSLA